MSAQFFEQQADALRRSRLLLLLFALAVVLITAITTFCVYLFLMVNMSRNPTIMILVAIGVPAVILSASAYKIYQLSAGGSAVAKMVGARRIKKAKNLRERQFINVVEEMAIASGMPLPGIYVLDRERGINAFTAGYTLKDAIICVTEGCLNLLDRDELQGVVAHEFSHILHGDTRLNTRMIGVLFGISMIGLIGEKMLLFGSVEEDNRDMVVGDDGLVYFLPKQNTKGDVAQVSQDGLAIGASGKTVTLGIALMVVGMLGRFLATAIQSAVNRQREYLADASAVRFTRNPAGIGGALKKIGGWVDGSMIYHADMGSVSHMLLHFGKNQKYEFKLYASHPPLKERIQRIDRHWDGEFIEVKVPHFSSEEAYKKERQQKYNSVQTAAFLSGMGVVRSSPSTEMNIPEAHNGWFPSTTAPFAELNFTDTNNVDYAHQLVGGIPTNWLEMARGTFAPCVVCALLIRMNPSESKTDESIQLIEQYRHSWVAHVKILLDSQHLITDIQRLPLLEIVLPNLSEEVGKFDVESFKDLLKALIQVDKKVSLFEWCTYTIVREYLHQLFDGNNLIPFEQYIDWQEIMPECRKLFSIVARYSNSGQMVNQAFQAACREMKLPENEAQLDSEVRAKDLSKILEKIKKIKPLQKPQLIHALLAIVQYDHKTDAAEQELLRAICLVIDNPMPPLS